MKTSHLLLLANHLPRINTHSPRSSAKYTLKQQTSLFEYSIHSIHHSYTTPIYEHFTQKWFMTSPWLCRCQVHWTLNITTKKHAFGFIKRIKRVTKMTSDNPRRMFCTICNCFPAKVGILRYNILKINYLVVISIAICYL